MIVNIYKDGLLMNDAVYKGKSTPVLIRNLLLASAAYHALFAFISGFRFDGLSAIMFSECGLVTDYIAVGGLGASFMNAAIVILVCIGAVQISAAAFCANSLASILMSAGFAFFGINPVNLIPILTGTWIYSLLKKESFGNYVHVGIWAGCAGPVVQYLFHHAGFSGPVNAVLGIAGGILAGIMVPACAQATARGHQGMNLYNAGFASGIVLAGVSAVLKGFGYTFESVMSWNTDYRTLIFAYLAVQLVLWMIAGFLINGKTLNGLARLGNRSGHKCDFVSLDGLGAAMMNMSLTGLIGLVYILIIGGDPSGPVISGIMSMYSFGAIGKHYKNVLWVLLGIVLLSFVSVWNLSDPAVQFSALLGTCICPFAGKYGPLWGVIAGMLHISLVRQTGSFHSWLNLYNNGFAAGIVAMILQPLASAVARDRDA